MKLPPVIGPPAALRVAAVPAPGAVAQPPQGQGQLEGDHHAPPGAHFHAPKPGQRGASLRSGAPPKKAAPQRRRARSKNLEPDDDEPETHVDDAESTRIGAGLGEAQFDKDGDANSESRDGEGTRQERRVLASARWFEAKAAQPAAAGPALGDVIAQLHRTAQGADGAPGQAPRNALTVAAWAETARKHLASQGTEPATLAAVREALLAFTPAAWSDAARSESVRLWLPVFLLNLARPRTKDQLAQAEATLRLLQRAGGSQPAALSAT